MLKKRYWVVVLLLVANFALKANIDNLAGTLDILKPEYRQYSVLHGAVAWEKEWVMNIWDLAWDRKKADIAAGEKKDELINPGQASALVKVVDSIFHRPPQTAGRANFTPNAHIKERKPQDVATAVAEILSISCSDKFKEYSKNFQTIQVSLNDPEFMQKYGTELKGLKLSLPLTVQNLQGAFSSLKKLKPKSEQIDLQAFHTAAMSVAQKKGGFGSFAEKFSHPADYISVQPIELINALFENTQETKLVLLALVWYCCKHDKKLIVEYYRQLDAFINPEKDPEKTIFTRDIDWDGWANAKFTSGQASEMLGRIRTEAGTAPAASSSAAAQSSIEDRPALYEAVVYAVLMPDKYPRISGYKSATLWYNSKTYKFNYGTSDAPLILGIHFSDCMDSTIMNFMCILAYNHEKKTFDLDTLNSRGKGELQEKGVHFFRSEHPAFESGSAGKKMRIEVSPSSIEEPPVHNAWTDVISNIDGVAYFCCLDFGKKHFG